MKLYTYWRSSCSYRVRIALNLKGRGYDSLPVHLLKGEQEDAAYTAINPSAKLPTLVLDDGGRLTQSLAIIDWIDATWPMPPLLPDNPYQRARVLAASYIIAMDTQPVTNSGTVAFLRKRFGASTDEAADWMRHWMAKGLTAFSASIDRGQRFAFGQVPGLAEICLVPQLYNARRWGLDIAEWPQLAEIEKRCMALPAFAEAAPEAQPDAET
ncbi:maleylacetoacetate isomerase [Rhodobacterales bacterium HKCCE2091]|nr:maleylacetoacetate isomerase [Rhodobacterales bacterium HKCCE2091]